MSNIITDCLQVPAWPTEVLILGNDTQSRQKLKIIRGCLPQFPWNCPQAKNKLMIWFLAIEPRATLGWNCSSRAFARNTAHFSFAGHFRHNLVMQPSITLPSSVNNPTQYPRHALITRREFLILTRAELPPQAFGKHKGLQKQVAVQVWESRSVHTLLMICLLCSCEIQTFTSSWKSHARAIFH